MKDSVENIRGGEMLARALKEKELPTPLLLLAGFVIRRLRDS